MAGGARRLTGRGNGATRGTSAHQINRTTDPADQRRIMRQFEKRTLDAQAHQFLTLWWHRIIPHRSYVKGWKISPSHDINQDLGNVWLAQ